MNSADPIRNIEDINKMIENLPPDYCMIFKIGIAIGLRISDILALNIDIVGKDEVKIKEKKTGKTKVFPINEKLKKDIKEYYLNVRMKKYVTKERKKDERALFVTKHHGRYERSAVYRMFNKVAKEQNININIGTHTMRKTFGYHHYKQYGDIALLQAILNHSAPSITLRYIGVTQDDINDSYKNFCLVKEPSAIIRDKEQDIRKNNAHNFVRKVIKEEFNKIKEEIRDYIDKIIIDNFQYMQTVQNKKLNKILGYVRY